MTAGLNLTIDVWRMSQATDDETGGAVITGTVVYSALPASIFSRRPTQESLEQGLEVPALYDMTVNLKNVTLFERDEIEVKAPSDSPHYNLRFRIVGVQPAKRRPKYAHQHVTLSRIRRSRRQQ